MNLMDYTCQVKNNILNAGADLVGIADTDLLTKLDSNPPNLLDGYKRAVSIAVRLPNAVFDEITDGPTPNYTATVYTANRLLDQLALRTALLLEKDGFLSLPIAASQILDREKWSAAISHKAVARMAGLGWQGKNLLLITPQFGSKVRLATVLTTAPLTVDGPIENRCKNCTLCRDACPAGAIKGVTTTDHYKSRNEALFFLRCVEKLTEDFAKQPTIGASVCGVCIKVCPFGRSVKKGIRHELVDK